MAAIESKNQSEKPKQKRNQAVSSHNADATVGYPNNVTMSLREKKLEMLQRHTSSRDV